MSLRSKLLDFLRVPHEPSAPQGDQDLQVFRAAPNFYWYRFVGWFLRTAVGAVGVWIALGFAAGFAAVVHQAMPDYVTILGIRISEGVVVFGLGLLEFGAVAGFLMHAVSSLVLLRLDYEQRWYLVSDRSLRIREGLVKLHEKTMTFANVQHVSIRQGPLQRLLRIADLEVRTAGGQAGGEGEETRGTDLHVAYFRGIDNAEAVRDAIRERLRAHRDAGLGDPDDSRLHHEPDVPLLAAARALADEARGLRVDLARS